MRHTSRYFTTLLALLFLVTPFYFQPNTGGIGLDLTYNIPAWAIASYVIAGALLLIAITHKFTRPANSWAFLVFPAVMILSGILAGSSQPISWLFRQTYIIGGLLFLFSLFQFEVGQRIGADPTWVVALQAVGGAAGNMICVHNVVAASAVVGLAGREGAVIRKTVWPFAYYALIAGLLGALFIALL